MNIKAIIFDNDGVLTDSEIVYGLTLTQLLEAYGVNEDVRTISELTAGKAITTAFKTVEDSFNIKLNDNALDVWDEKANKYFEEKLKACDGALDVLEEFSIQGLKMAIASTSARWKLKIKHKSTGVDKFFSKKFIFSGEEVENHKPAPDVYLYAAAGIGENPKDCLAVEDSISGIKSAKAAGMLAVGYTGASHIFDKESHRQSLLSAGADAVINDMSELPKLIEELSK